MATEKRLTEKHYNGKGYYMKCSGLCHFDGHCANCDELVKIVDRLGEYEDKAKQTVDVAEVDEIRVDILKISIENQETVLNISICGKPNEVKVPFSKEVAEVVHGQWIAVPSSDMMTGKAYKCSECGKMRYGSFMPNYCQNCGTKMDGGADNGC